MQYVKHMLTTVDNPNNPFENYDEWLAYDEEFKYYTNSYLARVAVSSDEISEDSQDQAIEDAINEIVSLNPLGLYRKVSKTVEIEGY